MGRTACFLLTRATLELKLERRRPRPASPPHPALPARFPCPLRKRRNVDLTGVLEKSELEQMARAWAGGGVGAGVDVSGTTGAGAGPHG